MTNFEFLKQEIPKALDIVVRVLHKDLSLKTYKTFEEVNNINEEDIYFFEALYRPEGWAMYVGITTISTCQPSSFGVDYVDNFRAFTIKILHGMKDIGYPIEVINKVIPLLKEQYTEDAKASNLDWFEEYWERKMGYWTEEYINGDVEYLNKTKSSS